MPQIVETQVFTFDELSDDAKDKAREWYREASCHDEWWDAVYDDATQCGKILGIRIDKIYFSGFWSQGDCAQFEGDYSYAKGSTKAIREYAPKDETLHKIADTLQAI